MLRTRALFNNLIDISLRWNTTFLCDSSGQSAIKLSKCDLHYCYSSALYGWIAETTQEQNQKLDSPCDEAAATWMPRWCNIPSQPRILSANSNTEDITGLQYAYWIAFTVKFTSFFGKSIQEMNYLRPEILDTWLEGVLQRFQLIKIPKLLHLSTVLGNTWASSSEGYKGPHLKQYLTGKLLKLTSTSD